MKQIKIEWGGRGYRIGDELVADSIDASRTSRILKTFAQKNHVRVEGPDWDLCHPFSMTVDENSLVSVREELSKPSEVPSAPVRTSQIWDDDNPTGKCTDQYGRRMS